MNNMEVSNVVLDWLRKKNYKPYNITKQDGYFIFDYEKDSVTIFKVRGLHGWLFGLWVGVGEDNNYIQIFAQHKDNIDKFKPSASVMVVRYSKNEFENIINKKYAYSDPHELYDMVGMIKRHPLLTYKYDRMGYMGFFDENLTLEYLGNKAYIYWDKIKESTTDVYVIAYNKSKITLCKRNPVLKSIELVDRNIDGWVSSPRFKVNIQFKDDSFAEDEIKFLDRWFKKDRYKNLDIDYGKNGESYVYCTE